MALSKKKQDRLRRLESERRKWGYLGDNAETEYEMLKREQGVVSGSMKQGKTKFIASARIDRDMGHALSSALKPEGVDIRLTNKSRGQTDIDTYSGTSVYLSSKSRWEDAQVATRRAGNAPALPVIKALLPPAMLNVWLGIEGAQSAIKQADWTHNRKIVTEQQRWLSKKDADKDSSISLQDLAQRSALGVPFPASEFVTGSHDRLGLDKRYFDWFDQNSDQLEQAVAQSESLEDLAEVALWVGEELGLIESEEQQEPDEPDNGQKSTDSKPPDNQDDSDGGDGDDSDDDDADSQDSPPDDSDETDSDETDETDSDSSSDEGEDNQDKPESSEPEEDNRTLTEKLKDSIAEAMLQEDNSEPKQNELFDLQAKTEEKVIKIPASETVTTDIVLDYWAKAVADDFQMPTQEFDDYFGEPQADLLHEIRMGILDVFDEDREEAPQLIIAVDVSISMNCMCTARGRNHLDEYYSAGWLAWQVAGLLGQQFPTAEIFAWSTTRSRDIDNRGGLVEQPFAAPVPVGKRPLCKTHEGSFSSNPKARLMGNTPEAEAMLHAQTLLDSNENSVLVLVTDGDPQNKARAHGVSHAMYQAGTRFSVVTVGSYQISLEEMHYPPATVVSIKNAKDLSKVSKTFAMMQE